MKKNFIIEDDVESLSACTFEQTLAIYNVEKFVHFTDPLNEEEECLVVERYLIKPDIWRSFVGKYLEHYTLAPKAVHLLIEHVNQPCAAELVMHIFATYGSTESEIRFFLKQPCSGQARRDILKAVSENPHIFAPAVFQLLEQIDLTNSTTEHPTKYAQDYRHNAETMRRHRYN